MNIPNLTFIYLVLDYESGETEMGYMPGMTIFSEENDAIKYAEMLAHQYNSELAPPPTKIRTHCIKYCEYSHDGHCFIAVHKLALNEAKYFMDLDLEL